MSLKFGKRTLFITLFTVLAALCVALAFFFLLPTSKTQASADGNNHTHDGWSKLTSSSNTSLSSGNYYLSGTVKANISVQSGATVTLCLNGNTLTAKKSGKVVIDVLKDANLILCDCSGSNSGTVTGASRKSYGGGGVYVHEGATFTMYGGTISGNTAQYGGGVYLDNVTKFTMYGGVISSNKAKYDGGGVYVTKGATFEMNDGTITKNSGYTKNKSRSHGGGVCVVGTGEFTMTGGTISYNWVAYTGLGSGVYITDTATFTMDGGNITYNGYSGHTNTTYHFSDGSYYTFGGGVHVAGDASFVMNDGTISYNHATYGGGVRVTDYGTFTMNGGTIENNIVRGGNSYGSNISVRISGSVKITGGLIGKGYYCNIDTGDIWTYVSECVLVEGNGKVSVTDSCYLSSSAYSSLSKYIKSGYTAVTTGLSTYSYIVVPKAESTHAAHADGTTYDSLITELGGTISEGNYYLIGDVTLESNLTVSSGTVTLCLSGYTLTGNGSGSVITVKDGATLILCDCGEDNSGTITGGNAYNGGGVYVTGSGTLIMNGGTITGNTASNDGGGVCVNSGTFIMNGGVISGNTASHDGTCICVGEGSTFTMTGGTIDGLYIYKCTADIEGGTIDGLIWNNCSTLNIKGGYYSCSYGTNDGTTNVYGGYFNETAYSKFAKSNTASESSLVNLTELLSVIGTQPDSGYSADYPYAVYTKGEYSFSNITQTYGQSYASTLSSASDYTIYSYNGTTTTELPTEAGTYEVTATIITLSSDNEISASVVTFTVVIQSKELNASMFTITGTYIYNGEEQNASYTYQDTDEDSAVLTEDDFDVEYTYNTGAGTAIVTFTGKNNYSGTVSLEYQIAKANYDTDSLMLKNLTVTYDGSAQSLTVSGTLPTGVTVTYYYEGTDGTSYSKTTTAPTNAGIYTVTAEFNGDFDNYNTISGFTATLTIEKATYETEDLSFDNIIVTYDGEAHALTVSGLPTGVEVTYYYEGVNGTEYEKTTDAPTNAGSYTVTAVFSVDTDNYNEISTLTATLVIEKAEVPLSSDVIDALSSITANVGDSLEDIELPEGWTWSSKTKFTSAGEYEVQATYSAGDNYETLTADITILVSGISASDKVGIIGIAIGCAAFVIFVMVFVVLYNKKRKDNN